MVFEGFCSSLMKINIAFNMDIGAQREVTLLITFPLQVFTRAGCGLAAADDKMFVADLHNHLEKVPF